MMWLAANWKLLLIVALTGLLMASWNRYAKEHDARITEQAIYQERIAQADAKAKEIEARSTKTIKVIHANHDKKLADAISNARLNWGAVRLPSQSTMPGDHDHANGAAPSDAAGADCLVGAAPAVIDQCAATTVQVIEWQEWARMNRLPVEGE